MPASAAVVVAGRDPTRTRKRLQPDPLINLLSEGLNSSVIIGGALGKSNGCFALAGSVSFFPTTALHRPARVATLASGH